VSPRSRFETVGVSVSHDGKDGQPCRGPILVEVELQSWPTDERGCHTRGDGLCISEGPCLHIGDSDETPCSATDCYAYSGGALTCVGDCILSVDTIERAVSAADLEATSLIQP
jgi:hypothetical protein